jgi:hypothetical protein
MFVASGLRFLLVVRLGRREKTRPHGNGGRAMGHGYSILGFVVIVILYAVIGLMAVAGTIFIAQNIFAP